MSGYGCALTAAQLGARIPRSCVALWIEGVGQSVTVHGVDA